MAQNLGWWEKHDGKHVDGEYNHLPPHKQLTLAFWEQLPPVSPNANLYIVLLSCPSSVAAENK